MLLAFATVGERALAGLPGASVAMMSASQGGYTTTQFLLDITQGARVANSSYPHSPPPQLAVAAHGSAAQILGWPRVRRRASAAPQILTPGLLAARLGGAAYAGTSAGNDLDALAAASSGGTIAAFSLGSQATLGARVQTLLSEHALVIADAPDAAGLRALAETRRPGELLLLVQRVPDSPGGELLWTGAVGLGGGRELTSETTQERGLVSSVDIAPTILTWLGRPIPAEMRGARVHTDGPLHDTSLRGLMARLRVIGGRRLKALGFLLCGWAALMLAAAPWPTLRGRAIRAGAIGLLWAPVAVMATAALEPSAAVEYATLALCCLLLGALSDALLPWPRAAIAPALAAPIAITVDALAHTQLLMRSLLGPDPILGARFYGVGNELKSALAVSVLAALAGALHPSRRGRRAALAVALVGVVLAVVEGSARIGAGVGGVILVSAGFAVATILMLPGAPTRRRALVVLISPIAGLLALAAIDLATAHGSGHFTGSVLHARSAGDVRDIIVRRYKAAWDELRNHAMPVATALALAAGAIAVRRRERLLAPIGSDPGWLAALAGGLSAGLVGAFVEDSGPVLLVVATFALVCVLAYLWAPPAAVPRTRTSAPEIT